MNWLKYKQKPRVLSPLEGYNRWAASYQNESNPIKDFSDQLIQNLLPDLVDKSILDFGCGTGKFCMLAEKQNASRILGLDLSPAMIKHAKINAPKTEFICADISQSNLEENSFDVVMGALVLGHVELLEPCLNTLLRSLKSGGVFIITDFHPFLTLLQAKRTFLDTTSNKHFEVRHYLHLFQDYFRIFTECHCALEIFEERLFNDTPVVFGMKARKK